MKKWPVFAFLSMILSGIVVIFQKYVTVLQFDNFISHYLGISYLFGFFVCVAVVLIRKYRVDVRTVVYGAVGGIFSFLGSYLYIAQMGVFPAYIVIPIFSFGIIVAVSVGSALIFREKLERRQYFALAVGLLAVVALSI